MRHLATATLISLALAACGAPPTAPAASPDLSDGVFDPIGQNLPQVPVRITDTQGNGADVIAFAYNGKLLYQNDILVGETAQAGAGQVGALATPVSSNSRWPRGIIPYAFRPDVPAKVREHVARAVETFNAQSNVRWVPRSDEVFYVQFIVDDSCYSYVGRSSLFRQPQPISLGRGECGLSGALHEMAHAAGLYHEQSRPDRDRHVKIRWENIPANWHSQYRVGLKSTAYGAYDYASLMHYPAFFGGKLAIEPLDPQVKPASLGRARTLSAGDLSGLRELYPDAP